MWKDVYFYDFRIGEWIDYRGLYQVSNLGRVKSLERVDASNHKLKSKILKPSITDKNYHRYTLCKNGETKTFSCHRLVAFMFIENDNPKETVFVNHKDENPSNNCAYNLEWCTPLYNVTYGTCLNKRNQTRLTNNNLKEIVGVDENNNIKYIIFGKLECDKYNLNFSHVYECCRNNHENKKGRKIHKKCEWFYYEDYLKLKGEDLNATNN